MNKEKQYKDMMKRYKKLFKKDVENLCPWDWSFGLDLLINFLKWMLDYYKLGYNVWAAEDPTKKTRVESLQETLKWYDRWMTCCDDYYKIAHNEEELKHYLSLGFHLVSKDEEISSKFNEEHGYYSLTLYEGRENVEACNKAYNDYKHKFFECLEKHLEEWWD